MDPILAQMRRERTANPLSDKQRWQLLAFASKTQSYLPFNEVTFLELINLTINVCCSFKYHSGIESKFRNDLALFRQKYYPHGFKVNNRFMNNSKYSTVLSLKRPRFALGLDRTFVYRPIETIAFIMAQRACYRYIISEDNEENIQRFIDKLKQIAICIS